MTTKRLRYLMRWLRKAHPLDMPVRVVRGPGTEPSDYGEARKRTAEYYIWINNTLPDLLQELVLLEEYAHCMAWAAQLLMTTTLDHEVLWAMSFSALKTQYGGDLQSVPKI